MEFERYLSGKFWSNFNHRIMYTNVYIWIICTHMDMWVYGYWVEVWGYR